MELLQSTSDNISDGHVVYNTYKVKRLCHTADCFVDLTNRVCSCLHFQIYHYCAHLLHVALVKRDLEVSANITEAMGMESVNAVNIDLWRHIGRDDDVSTSAGNAWSTINVDEDSGISLIDSTIQDVRPCYIGNNAITNISSGLTTLSRDDRMIINTHLEAVYKMILERQQATLFQSVPSVTHNGNRQDSDLSVKPLFERRKRKSQSIDKGDDVIAEDITIPALIRERKAKRARLPTAISTSHGDGIPTATLAKNVGLSTLVKGKNKKRRR
jgi:hypothetical protein